MSNIIFPVGFTIELPNLNIEMMQHYAKMWNLEHTKMSKGEFQGKLSVIHTPRIQLGTSHYSQRFMSRGDFPDGCIVLIYSTTKAVYSFQNKSIAPNEIIMLKKGEEIDILTSCAMDVHTMVLEEQLFYKALYAAFGELPPASLKDKRLTIHPDKIGLFHHTVNLWKNYLSNELPKLTTSPDYTKIESTILQELFTCLLFKPSTRKREKFQTKTIRDLLHEKITQEINIGTLTNELQISQSQLHHAFKKDYGMTPKKYLQQLRFNAIKKELLVGHPHSNTISQIANKYNFFHMGHFSAEYKKLFGETPLQTLNAKL